MSAEIVPEITEDLGTDVDAFLHSVLLDGRHLKEFKADPMEVSRALKIELAPETVKLVRELSFESMMEHLYINRFQKMMTESAPGQPHVSPTPGSDTNEKELPRTPIASMGLGIVIVSVAIVAGVVITYTIVRGKPRNAIDNSPGAEHKL